VVCFLLTVSVHYFTFYRLVTTVIRLTIHSLLGVRKDNFEKNNTKKCYTNNWQWWFKNRGLLVYLFVRSLLRDASLLADVTEEGKVFQSWMVFG